MKTFFVTSLKMLAVVGLGLLMFHFWPVAVVPFAAAFVVVLVLGALLVAGVFAVGAAGLGAITGIVAAALVLLVVLSPVWIPVALILGIIWLARQPGASKPSAARPA
jgi:hypothetical protein